MAQFITKELLADMEDDVKRYISRVEHISNQSEGILNAQPAADRWSVVQVLAHLNSYNRYYLPHMQAAINAGSSTSFSDTFRSGWLGNYFVKTMYSDVQTKKAVANKMKSPKEHRPGVVLDAQAVIKEFIEGEQKMLQLLHEARQLNIAEVKVPISIARWIKISLGDTFRFMVAHQERHLLQIDNTLAAVAGK